MGFKSGFLVFFILCLYAHTAMPLPQHQNTTTPNKTIPANTTPQTISLEECIQSARWHYPLHQNKQLLDESLKLELQRLHLTYIPRIKFSSKASYQSDVTTLPFNSQTLSSIPPLANALSDYRPLNQDQYNFNIEISQPIIDSLNVWANKAIISKQYAIAKTNIDKELYKVQQSIINAYFSSLLIDKQIAQLQIHKKELQKNHSYMLKRYKNGVGRQSDVDKLQIEIFNADKTLKSLQAQHFTTLAILTELSGINLHNAKLQIPDKAQSLTYLQTTLVRLQEDSSLLFKNRPEIDFFTLKQEEAHLQKRLELSKSMPYIDAFFQGGYANLVKITILAFLEISTPNKIYNIFLMTTKSISPLFSNLLLIKIKHCKSFLIQATPIELARLMFML